MGRGAPKGAKMVHRKIGDTWEATNKGILYLYTKDEKGIIRQVKRLTPYSRESAINDRFKKSNQLLRGRKPNKQVGDVWRYTKEGVIYEYEKLDNGTNKVTRITPYAHENRSNNVKQKKAQKKEPKKYETKERKFNPDTHFMFKTEKGYWVERKKQ